jgi:pyroglutamyl-peptidase
VNDDLLITGFTAFGRFAANPAEAIARGVAVAIGARLEPLEVSFAAVEVLAARLRLDPPGRWLMLGVAGDADRIRVERVARNWVGAGPDVRGMVRGPGRIDPAHPADALSGTLLPAATDLPPGCGYSDDAGDYLCNFAYWRALVDLPGTRAGFVHVAPADRASEHEQVRAVLDLIGR